VGTGIDFWRLESVRKQQLIEKIIV
jgi:hypothetical protein